AGHSNAGIDTPDALANRLRHRRRRLTSPHHNPGAAVGPEPVRYVDEHRIRFCQRHCPRVRHDTHHGEWLLVVRPCPPELSSYWIFPGPQRLRGEFTDHRLVPSPLARRERPPRDHAQMDRLKVIRAYPPPALARQLGPR